MKKIVMVAVLAVFSVLVFAPAASAVDYRPWKQAMWTWADTYGYEVWAPAYEYALNNGQINQDAIFDFPAPGMTMAAEQNNWGAGSRAAAQTITSIEGPFPCGQFTKILRDILRDYVYLP